MSTLIQWVHTYAFELMGVWAVFSVILSALPTPDAYASYYNLPKAPNWYKTVWAVSHFIAMNWGRASSKFRVLSTDRSSAGVINAKQGQIQEGSTQP